MQIIYIYMYTYIYISMDACVSMCPHLCVQKFIWQSSISCCGQGMKNHSKCKWQNGHVRMVDFLDGMLSSMVVRLSNPCNSLVKIVRAAHRRCLQRESLRDHSHKLSTRVVPISSRRSISEIILFKLELETTWKFRRL